MERIVLPGFTPYASFPVDIFDDLSHEYQDFIIQCINNKYMDGCICEQAELLIVEDSGQLIFFFKCKKYFI